MATIFAFKIQLKRMNRNELESFWSEMLRSDKPTERQFNEIATAIVEVHSSGDTRFRQHITNRLKQITDRTQTSFGTDSLDISTARLLVADEMGFETWDDLTKAIGDPTASAKPTLFQYSIAAMARGDFSALESMVGGSEKFHDQIVYWYEKGYFADEEGTLAEVFSAACMLGHPRTAEYLLDKGVDPYEGMKTGLSGFHYAASSGRLDVIKLLIDRKVPMEVENMYGGTVFGQAIWSAVNEYTPDHAEIVERLIEAGAVVEDGYLDWWEKQAVPSPETKKRVADALRRHDDI